MNRTSEAQLLDLCASQHGCFDAAAWEAFDAVRSDELAAAALFLSAVDWYGHRGALREVAATLHDEDRLAEVVRATGFDCSRFSNMLRRRLSHVGAAS